MTRYDILIVGAGHAGAQAALSLRQLKFEGSIALLGDETSPPYERPPLSKDYMSGEKAFERILIRPASFWSERSVDLLLGRHVVSIDAAERSVTLRDGAQIGYEKLIWATGGAPRQLGCAGGDAEGVHSIRTRDDVDAIVAKLGSVQNVAIVGGGYIGLEAAAVMAKFGKKVVLLEALDRVLARVAGEDLSRFYEAEHRRHGVDVRVGAIVEEVVCDGGHATGVKLAGGEIVPADIVIVGIGIIPATRPLIDAGAAGINGVDVDTHCRTSLPDVYAIGDCAAHVNRYAGGSTIRLESVQNANDQAKVAAQDILGTASPYDAVPWFWSTQYDLKLQTIGISSGHDQAIVRGDLGSGSFSIVYLKEERVIALDCVNNVKDYVQGRALILASSPIDLRDLGNASLALKDLKLA